MSNTERRYKGYTLSEAKTELELWKDAKRAAATGQSYSIGGRQLTRYNLSEINAQIAGFVEIIDTLASGCNGPVKVRARMRRW